MTFQRRGEDPGCLSVTRVVSWESEAIIAAKGAARRLGRLPKLDPLDRDSLAAAFAENFQGLA